MTANKCAHNGHRKRLLETVLKVGLDNVSEIQAIEYVLTYILPRGDVNEIAHRLLDKFGSLSSIINADFKQLSTVRGIGEKSAKKLHAFAFVFDFFAEDLLDKKYSFEYRGNIGDYFEELLKFRSSEVLYIIAVDPAGRVKIKLRLVNGTLSLKNFDLRQVAKFIMAFKPAYLFLAHNHPTSNSKPSAIDLEIFKQTRELCLDLNLPLVDYVIVGFDGVYSLANDWFYCKF